MTIFGICYPKFSKFVMHNHVARWQDLQYMVSLEMLKESEILSLIDFIENYSFKCQYEIQEQHWFNFHLSILVHIIYQVEIQHGTPWIQIVYGSQ